MTTHDDLLRAAALAQAEHPGELEYLFAEKMLAAVEPIIRADERSKHPGIFDVITGSCGHTWLRSDAGVPGGCPICFDVDCKVKSEEARVRADERERIAQAIEAAMESHLNCPHPECAQSYRDAACIARGEEQP